MKFLSFFCIALTCTIGEAGLAQDNEFFPGFYVTSAGDTMKGYVSIEHQKSIASFRFKNLLQNQDFQNVLFDSCKAVSCEKGIFENWNVIRDMSYVDKFSFTIVNADSVISAMIPLKQLYKGAKFSLYYYNDIKDHFFVYDGKYMQELSLTYRYLTDFEKMQYNRNTPKYYVNANYKNQLRVLMDFKLTNKQRALLDHTEYEQTGLIKLFKDLNGAE